MHEKKIKILITDGDYKHTLGAIRYLSKAGFQVDSIGPSVSISRWSRYNSRVVFNKSCFCERQIKRFLKFLKAAQYDVLLPIGAKSVYIVSKFRDEIEKYCRVPVASFDQVKVCMDKVKTYAMADNLKMRVPKVWAFESIEELYACIDEIKYPVVIKGRHETQKDKVLYAHNKDQMIEGINTWGKNLALPVPSFPIIQQYIKGTGCGFFALYQKGECKQVFMHRRIRQTPPSGGPSCCSVSIFESDLLSAGKQLLDKLNWHGVAMIEFKREANTGNLFLMEINPKFWGSLELSLACGVNFPALAVWMAMGKRLSYRDKYPVGLRFHWPINGELDHIMENPRAIMPVVLDCMNPKVKSNLWLKDPGPACFSLFQESKKLVRRVFKK